MLTQEALGSIGAIIFFTLAFAVFIVLVWPGGIAHTLLLRRLSGGGGSQGPVVAPVQQHEPYQATTARLSVEQLESERLKDEIALQDCRQLAQESNEVIQALIEQLRQNGITPVRELNGRQKRAAAGDLPAVELVNLMEMCFDEADFDDILFQMGIIPGAISGETLPARLRALVRYCQRRGRLVDLVNVCRKERPRIKWPDAK